MPYISIIVCTLNRPESLARTLDSITVAVGDMRDIEAVIVDNGSTKETFDLVRKWAQAQPFTVIMRYEKNRGLAKARNKGIKTARGDFLVFTDDDCRLAPDYFLALRKHYGNDAIPIMRGGKVELGDPTDLPFTIKTDEDPARMSDIDHPGCLVVGANMIIPRSIIEEVGYFDSRFGAGACFKSAEDTDYTLRVHRAGFIVEYQPDIIVKHFHGRKDHADIIKLSEGYNIGNGALYAKHCTDIQFLKHFYWDIRKWIKGYIFRPEVGLSYTSVILGNAKGFLLYWKRNIIDGTFCYDFSRYP